MHFTIYTPQIIWFMGVMSSDLSQPPLPELASRILIVDDDAEIRTLLGRYLKEHGYEVTSARDGIELREQLKLVTPTLIVLDLMLPGPSGYDLCREIRQKSSIPILMLTARGEEADRIIGLELGADDYLAKPFSPRELLARIRAILRRANSGTQTVASDAGGYSFMGWQLDTGSHSLTTPEGEQIDLSGGEYDVLLALVEHPQRVLSRDQLLDLARHRLAGTFDRSIDVQISRLRRKLAAAGGHELIKTIRGAGYMFTSPVKRQ